MTTLDPATRSALLATMALGDTRDALPAGDPIRRMTYQAAAELKTGRHAEAAVTLARIARRLADADPDLEDPADRPPNHPELVGDHEIAERTGAARATIRGWRARYPSFPRPAWTIAGRPVWQWSDVCDWLNNVAPPPPAWTDRRPNPTTDTTDQENHQP